MRFPLPAMLGAAVAVCLTTVPIARAEPAVANDTALDRYIAQEDEAFAWKVVDRRASPLGSELAIELTSQTWRAPGEVDRTEWKHWLIVAIPNNPAPKTAMLVISGGRNRDEEPPQGRGLTRGLALATGGVVAELRMVPNQPLEIRGDGQRRFEDDLLARSWVEYLKTKDPEWIAQLPMTKSAVRAMDAVQAALAAEEQPIAIDKFVVTGGSKRGWTTWLTAAVDQRVCAIAPMVIDVLNIEPSMRHHRSVYGFWSEALGDYVGQGITDRLGAPEVKPLLGIVDPYRYRERFTMPKLIINATGDEFFLPDSSRYYFDDLVGEKHLCYVANAGHSLNESAVHTLAAFYDSVLRDVERPTIDWSVSEDGTLRVECSAEPILARLLSATNPKARDFRRAAVGDVFFGRPLEADEEGVYVAKLQAPKEGWSATLAQFDFDLGGPRPLRLTTPVWVTPDTEPFAGEGNALGATADALEGN